MTTYNTMTTRAAGYVVPASEWNKIKYNFDATRQIIGLVRRAAVQSINDSATTAISFDTQDIDDENYIDIAGNPTRITLPRKGIYLFDILVQFASDADGNRLVTMPRSGGGSDRGQYMPAISGAETDVAFSYITAERAAGDYYEISAWHNAGAALNITARVAVTLLCDRT